MQASSNDEGLWVVVETRIVQAWLRPLEDIWTCLGRMQECIDIIAFHRGCIPVDMEAFHDGGSVKVRYSLILHETDLFPKPEETIH